MKIDTIFGKLFPLMSKRVRHAADGYPVSLGLLKTMMMIAAVDGDISKPEMALYWKYAQQLKENDDITLADIWKKALGGAGYLAMQALLLSEDELVDEFLKEVERDFVQKVASEPSEARKQAFECLKAMGEADGEYSPVERRCIFELMKRVKAAWELDVAICAAHI